MAAGLLIRNARQLLTLRGPSGPRRGNSLLEIGVIPDGAVIMRNGVIRAVGPVRQVLSLAAARDCEEIDASGKVVMPAFVDLETSLVHAHPPARTFERLLREYNTRDPEAFHGLLVDGARALSALSSHSLRRRAFASSRAMLRHGTGTLESRAGYSLNEIDSMKVLRVQTQCGPPGEVVSTLSLRMPQGENAVSWGNQVCSEWLPLVRKRRLARFVDLEFDSHTLPLSIALEILNCASQVGFSVKTSAPLLSSSSAARLAIPAGAISVGTLAGITRDEVDALAAASVIAVLKPGLSLQVGSDYHEPGRSIIDAGVIPALCSGYHAELSPGYNMQLILLLACRLYRWRPEEAISAATINNAHALRAEASVGSIETGKQADVLIMNVSDYREVCYYAGINVVDKVIKRGTVVYDSKGSAHDEDPD